MANFTSQDVMKLRTATGVGMLDCKKALVETDGDFDAAIKYLREKGIASAAKKADRIAAEGIVYATSNEKAAVLVEVNSETDFVARSEQFVNLVGKVANYVLNNDVQTIEELLSKQEIIDLVAEGTAAIGEKLSLRRFVKYQNAENTVLDTYIHMGGKIGVIVELSTASNDEKIKTLAHDICMQIAAAKPAVVAINDVYATALENEKEILRNQALNEGKPEHIVDKMVEGRIKKYYQEVCLYEQPFVKDSSKTIREMINEAIMSIGEKITIRRFTRYEMGEGLEKRVNDLAAEVAAQIAGN